MALKPGSFLISKPFLGDENFERSVVLLCRDSASEGTLGVIVNRPMPAKLGEVLPGPGAQVPWIASLPLFYGGPVATDRVHVLHRVPALSGAVPIGGGVSWGGDFSSLLELLFQKELSAADVRLYVGYSGWSPGQLAEERQRGSWITHPSQPDEVFAPNPTELWQRLLRAKGGRFTALSNYPRDPRSN